MSNNSEKLQSVAKAMQMVNQRKGFRGNLKAHWFELFRVPATKRTLSLLSRYAKEHGEEAVRHWMDVASINEIPADQVLRYITAIRPKKDLEDDY